MKRLFILAMPLVFTLFTACGGSEEPPPQALNGDNPEGLAQVEETAGRMKEVCAQELTPFVTQTAAATAFPQQAAPFAGQIQRPDAQGCQDQAMNFLMAYGTYYKGEANNPGPQKYLMDQFKNVGTKLGQNVSASGIPLTPSVVAGLVQQGKGLGNDVLSKLATADIAPATKRLLEGELGKAISSGGI